MYKTHLKHIEPTLKNTMLRVINYSLRLDNNIILLITHSLGPIFSVQWTTACI